MLLDHIVDDATDDTLVTPMCVTFYRSELRVASRSEFAVIPDFNQFDVQLTFTLTCSMGCTSYIRNGRFYYGCCTCHARSWRLVVSKMEAHFQ